MYERIVHVRTMHDRTVHVRTMHDRTIHVRTMHDRTVLVRTMHDRTMLARTLPLSKCYSTSILKCVVKKTNDIYGPNPNSNHKTGVSGVSLPLSGFIQ